MLVLLLSGPVAVGKTSLTENLTARHGMKRIRTGAYLAELAQQRGIAVNRTSLQTIGDGLDDATDYRWVLDQVAAPALGTAQSSDWWLLDSARKRKQVDHFRAHYGAAVVHVHLTAAEDLLRDRYERRRAAGGDYSTDVPYERAIQHPNEIASRGLIEIADATVDVSALTAADAARQVVIHCSEFRRARMRQIVLISGRLCTGKSGLANSLRDEYGYQVLKTSDVLKTYVGQPDGELDRKALEKIGDELDAQTSHRWIYEEAMTFARSVPREAPIVVDSIRCPEQLEHFRRDHSLSIIHVHLYASDEELERRFRSKNAETAAVYNESFAGADILKDKDIERFKQDADVRIFTVRSDNADTLVRVAARLGLHSSPDVRCVDVLVGGQYGSEGKGHVAAYLAREYDVLVRVGGPNAGHTVSSSSGVYTYHQLPSGARDTDAQLLLGPGMTINVESLLKEIDECKVTPERLFIDPQVMIIEEQDSAKERSIVKQIGSTGRGGGAAAARRILGRSPGIVRLARDIPELARYVGDKPPYRGATVRQLELAYRKGLSILLEGTQGSGLSIFHGQYPYVTSRDTNVAGCLAEAGISPSRVRRILLVIRTTPIRVGDPQPDASVVGRMWNGVREALGSATHEKPSSGPLKHETTFDEVARQANIDEEETKAFEKTSTTKRDRRVGWFDWEQFRNACSLNAPTDLVLTFADYIQGKNREARRFEQLTENTIKFVEELERVAQAPVSLINTRFPRESGPIDLRTVIDRRNWTGRRNR